MTKQDRIREGVAEFCRVMRAEGELRRFTPHSDADAILEYQHSQGVAIKVDSDPTVTEPLIKVKNDN